MPVSKSYRPSPRIAELGDAFYDLVPPAQFPKHQLRFRNQRYARHIGLDELTGGEWEAHFARFVPLPANLDVPLALRYHGHQFDVYNPNLGDGRGFLFAQVEDGAGRLLDLGTKGSGTTPWSRGGDGRLTLKGGVREVLATEMLEALGVNTSKSLSLFETGESLMRGDEPSPTRSSVLVRLSHSHIRFGTFQRLAHRGEKENLERLLAYAIDHYFPHLSSAPDPVHSFLVEVTRRSAMLAASYMVAGFVHGVLNSDNMNITGESFDYGPYRFLPNYDLGFVAAYFDGGGLYAYGRQPQAIFRNVVRLAEALRPLASSTPLTSAFADFESVIEKEVTARVLWRLGLASNPDVDLALISAVFNFLAASPIGFDQFFFDWYGGKQRESRALAPDAVGHPDGHYSGSLWDALRAILDRYEPLRADTPAYFEGLAPCTLLIDEIESIWEAIAVRDDWQPFCEKVTKIREMGAALRGDAPK